MYSSFSCPRSRTGKSGIEIKAIPNQTWELILLLAAINRQHDATRIDAGTMNSTLLGLVTEWVWYAKLNPIGHSKWPA